MQCPCAPTSSPMETRKHAPSLCRRPSQLNKAPNALSYCSNCACRVKSAFFSSRNRSFLRGVVPWPGYLYPLLIANEEPLYSASFFPLVSNQRVHVWHCEKHISHGVKTTARGGRESIGSWRGRAAKLEYQEWYDDKARPSSKLLTCHPHLLDHLHDSIRYLNTYCCGLKPDTLESNENMGRAGHSRHSHHPLTLLVKVNGFLHDQRQEESWPAGHTAA